MSEIKVRYSTVDGVSKSRKFKTVAGAQRFAQAWVGEAPSLGMGYAVSDDGIGKVEVCGAKLADLFPRSAGIA